MTDRDSKPVPPVHLDLLAESKSRRGLEDVALPSTRSSHRAPGLTAESLARMARRFAAVRADRRRADRARQQRTWRRLT